MFAAFVLIIACLGFVAQGYDINCVDSTAGRTADVNSAALNCLRAISEMVEEPDAAKLITWSTRSSRSKDVQVLPVHWGSKPCLANLYVDTLGPEMRFSDHFTVNSLVPIAVQIVNRCLVTPASGGRVSSDGGWVRVGHEHVIKFAVVVPPVGSASVNESLTSVVVLASSGESEGQAADGTAEGSS